MDIPVVGNVVGIVLEIIGFIFIMKSTKLLELASGGGFYSRQYIDPKTGEPPKTMESGPNPLLYKPGIWMW